MNVPAQRADAQRNRVMLLEAAARAFAEHGLDASAEAVAREAGVAKGTLFRHFPTKGDLIVAVFVDRLTALRTLIDEVTETRLPGLAALAEVMWAGAELIAADRSFFEAASLRLAANEDLAREKQALEDSLDALVVRAQRSGEVRADVSGADVAMLMMAATNTCAPVHDLFPQLWRRYLALMIDGLRSGATTRLPVRAARGTQVREALGASAGGGAAKLRAVTR
ncbi:MAG: TetR family transcriptional regulator [Solirubrobacteraceae bacterium]